MLQCLPALAETKGCVSSRALLGGSHTLGTGDQGLQRREEANGGLARERERREVPFSTIGPQMVAQYALHGTTATSGAGMRAAESTFARSALEITLHMLVRSRVRTRTLAVIPLEGQRAIIEAKVVQDSPQT